MELYSIMHCFNCYGAERHLSKPITLSQVLPQRSVMALNVFSNGTTTFYLVWEWNAVQVLNFCVYSIN